MFAALVGLGVIALIFTIAVLDVWKNWERDPDGSWNVPFFGMSVIVLSALYVFERSGIFGQIMKGWKILKYIGWV